MSKDYRLQQTQHNNCSLTAFGISWKAVLDSIWDLMAGCSLTVLIGVSRKVKQVKVFPNRLDFLHQLSSTLTGTSNGSRDDRQDQNQCFWNCWFGNAWLIDRAWLDLSDFDRSCFKVMRQRLKNLLDFCKCFFPLMIFEWAWYVGFGQFFMAPAAKVSGEQWPSMTIRPSTTIRLHTPRTSQNDKLRNRGLQ